MPRVVIVGAGISGLAAAFRLHQLVPAADITVLEQGSRPGGTVWTEERQGFRVEWGPNGFLDNKPFTLNLCRDLGLAEQLVAASDAAGKNRYLFWGGHLHLLPNCLAAFLRSKLLSWRGKLELVAERFRRRGPRGLDESIDAFARRRAGSETAAIIADALVTGIYAGDPALLSVRATFPRVAALEEQFGSVQKGLAKTRKQRGREARARREPSPRAARMWSLRDGLGGLIARLCERLPKPPLLGVEVRHIERAEPAWVIRDGGQQRWPADAVILACPAYRQAAMLANLDLDLAGQIEAIPYNRVAVVALGYRRRVVPASLNGFGYIAPQRTRRDLLGVQWCSSIFPGRAPADMVLLRAMCGGWNRPEVVGWDDARLLDAVQRELRLAMNIQTAPAFHSVIRWDRAIPQYHVGHLQRVAWIEDRMTRYPGLFLGSNAYHGVALNDCTEQAEILADRGAKYLIKR